MVDKAQKIPKSLHEPHIEQLFPNLQRLIPDHGEIDRAQLRAGLSQTEQAIKWLIEELQQLNRRAWKAMEQLAADASGSGLTSAQLDGSTYQTSNGVLKGQILSGADVKSGTDISIYAFRDQSATDVDTCLPKLGTNDKVLITLGNDGNYYLAWPALIGKGTSGSTVSSSAADMTGAVINSIGKHP